MKLTRLTVALLAATCACAAELPKAEEILNKSIEATGGRSAYEKVHSMISSGTIEIPAANIRGTIKIYVQEPDKMYSIADIAGVGAIEEGLDGATAWQSSAMQGARIKTGDEKAAALRNSNLRSHVDWQKTYASVETTGAETVDGKPVWVVKLTPKEGKPETEYYDQKSSLPVKMTTTVETPMGAVPVETLLSDYRSEGGLMQPHKILQNAAGQQFTITLDKVEINPEIPASRFDLPAEVKALLPKQ